MLKSFNWFFVYKRYKTFPCQNSTFLLFQVKNLRFFSIDTLKIGS
jgi:hypothetical protein